VILNVENVKTLLITVLNVPKDILIIVDNVKLVILFVVLVKKQLLTVLVVLLITISLKLIKVNVLKNVKKDITETNL